MGFFQHKQQPNKASSDSSDANQEHFFDEYFNEELRNHGRWYFEKIIQENGTIFKTDLDATLEQVKAQLKEHVIQKLDEGIAQVNDELRDHAVAQLDTQFSAHTKTIVATQAEALSAVTRSAEELKAQHEQLSKSLQEDISDQKALLHTTFEDNKTQITAMKESQAQATQWLSESVSLMQEQNNKLRELLETGATKQQDMLVNAFQENMAQVIEHYLLEVLGDQFDLKAQLPSIIEQLEANKQAIADDIRL